MASSGAPSSYGHGVLVSAFLIRAWRPRERLPQWQVAGAMLCDAMRCYAMLMYAMLCDAMPYSQVAGAALTVLMDGARAVPGVFDGRRVRLQLAGAISLAASLAVRASHGMASLRHPASPHAIIGGCRYRLTRPRRPPPPPSGLVWRGLPRRCS